MPTLALGRLDPASRAALSRTATALRDVVYPEDIFPEGPPRGREWGNVRVCKVKDFVTSVERLIWWGCTRENNWCQSLIYNKLKTRFRFHNLLLNSTCTATTWATANGCPLVQETCAAAAKYGGIEVVKWLYIEKECPWGPVTCANLAAYHTLEALQWARNQGCPWDCCVFSFLAYKGKLETIKWALEMGCPA